MFNDFYKTKYIFELWCRLIKNDAAVEWKDNLADKSSESYKQQENEYIDEITRKFAGTQPKSRKVKCDPAVLNHDFCFQKLLRHFF